MVKVQWPNQGQGQQKDKKNPEEKTSAVVLCQSWKREYNLESYDEITPRKSETLRSSTKFFQPYSPIRRGVQFKNREPSAKVIRKLEHGESSKQGVYDSNLFISNQYSNQFTKEPAKSGYEKTRRLFSGGKITIKQTPQFSTKPYIPHFSNSIMKEIKWYTKAKGKIVPMNTYFSMKEIPETIWGSEKGHESSAIEPHKA